MSISIQSLYEFAECSSTLTRIEYKLAPLCTFGLCEPSIYTHTEKQVTQLKKLNIHSLEELEELLKHNEEKLMYYLRIEMTNSKPAAFERGSSVTWLIEMLLTKK